MHETGKSWLTIGLFRTWPVMASMLVSAMLLFSQYAPLANGARPFDVSITSPVNGSVIAGLKDTGAPVKISGTTLDTRFDVQSVQVRVGLQPLVAAIPASPGDWSSWTASSVITTSGAQTIVATATYQNGRQSRIG